MLMKKLIQHPKICNAENVPYLQMNNEGVSMFMVPCITNLYY